MVGLSGEANGNTTKGVAFGTAATGLYGLTETLSIGLRAAASFATVAEEIDPAKPLIFTFEMQALLRMYMYSFKKIPVALFFQADAGAGFINMSAYSVTKFSFAGGMTAGVRIAAGKNLVIEMYFRDGYPVMWGGGILFGWKFKNTGGKKK